jgi:hypothetical protein
MGRHLPRSPPHPNNFDLLDNTTKHLYAAKYYHPDGTFMTTTKRRVVNTQPMPTGDPNITDTTFNIHMGLPTWNDRPQVTKTPGNSSRSNPDVNQWWEGLPDQSNPPIVMYSNPVHSHPNYKQCPALHGQLCDPCTGPN